MFLWIEASKESQKDVQSTRSPEYGWMVSFWKLHFAARSCDGWCGCCCGGVSRDGEMWRSISIRFLPWTSQTVQFRLWRLLLQPILEFLRPNDSTLANSLINSSWIELAWLCQVWELSGSLLLWWRFSLHLLYVLELVSCVLGCPPSYGEH